MMKPADWRDRALSCCCNSRCDFINQLQLRSLRTVVVNERTVLFSSFFSQLRAKRYRFLSNDAIKIGQTTHACFTVRLRELRIRKYVCVNDEARRAYLFFVPHRPFAAHHDFTSCLLLQLFRGHAPWAQNPPDKVELQSHNETIHY